MGNTQKQAFHMITNPARVGRLFLDEKNGGLARRYMTEMTNLDRNPSARIPSTTRNRPPRSPLARG